MTPTIADSLGITFYFLFWCGIFATAEQGLMAAGYLLHFNWIMVYLFAAGFSYTTVWLNKARF